MFSIQPNPSFEFDAQLTVPGQQALATVRFTGRHKGRQALQTWIKAADASANDAQFLGSALQGWQGVLDAAGAEVPYSTEALAQLLDAYPAAGAEIFDQYLKALSESRRKN